MKKILFLECAQNNGGARKAVVQMAKSLSGGYDVSIMDMYGSCKPFVDSCMASGIDFKVFSNTAPHFIRSSKSKIEKLLNVFTFIPHMITQGKKLKHYFKEKQIDYVCVSTFRPLMYFLFAKPQAKVVFFAHGWYIKSQLSRFNSFLLKKRADKIVGISQATKQALYNNSIASLSQLHVVHNSISVDVDVIKPALIEDSENCIKILLCGGFTPGKGQSFAIDLADELNKRGVPFKMILAGIVYRGGSSQNFLKRMQKKTTELGLDEKVLFIVDHDNVYDIIKACDLVIHPSETEGLPLSIMEAQLFKKPVIANGVGGVIDLISDRFTGYLPTHNSVDEYADIICEIEKNPQSCDDIVNRAYSQIKQCYSPEEQKRELINVFK